MINQAHVSYFYMIIVLHAGFAVNIRSEQLYPTKQQSIRLVSAWDDPCSNPPTFNCPHRAPRLRPMAAERTSLPVTGPELVAIECPLQLKADPDGQRERSRSVYDGLIDSLGGTTQLSARLAARDPNRPVELTLVKSSTNDYIRPVAGEWVQTSNILVKLIKRTRKPKVPPLAASSDSDAIQPIRLYKIEPVGVIPLTVRFRAWASLPSFGRLSVHARPQASDQHTGARHEVFELYRQNAPTVVTEAPDGSQRLLNRSRYVPVGPQTITWECPEVPNGPAARDLEQHTPQNETLFEKLSSLFEQRPIWSRMAFQQHLSANELRYIRHFQRISLRNVDRKEANDKFTLKLMKRTNTKAGTTETGTLDTTRFDGLELHQSVGTYQLCDISDPLLVSLINSTKGVLPKCDVRTGWYTSNAIEQIRSILRRKFHALLDEQRLVKDIECVDLLEIDVSQGAVDLLKKSASAHRRFKGALQNPYSPADQAADHGDRERPDAEVDSTDPDASSSQRRKPANSKPHHPNPLLKVRREKRRVRAKPVENHVAFTESSRRDVQKVYFHTQIWSTRHLSFFHATSIVSTARRECFWQSGHPSPRPDDI
ncbi:uncharacterized protein VP01_2237g5 [Puccinia sorghi]|uniref:Uncharacterized protein n=1 Tax=Puccinia sorghi TaxID=27349 RepID=A0A0L6V8M0_9BASI|nr:uncharacterized protein VP01_2237g5 [Puccinia sorghi]